MSHQIEADAKAGQDLQFSSGCKCKGGGEVRDQAPVSGHSSQLGALMLCSVHKDLKVTRWIPTA